MSKSTPSIGVNASVLAVNNESAIAPSPVVSPVSAKAKTTYLCFPIQGFTKKSGKLAKPFTKSRGAFRGFAELPMEIRLQIWQETIESRVHELHPCSHLYQNRMTFRSNASTTPPLFHVNRESRSVAMRHYQLMEYTPASHTSADGSGSGKGILRFYFTPKHDTLLLNSLMGLFVMFMLLEEESTDPNMQHILNTGGPTAGVMKGWERVAIDAERAQLITLLTGISGRAPQPRFKKLLPDLKELIVAFDYSKKGKTRFRTSVWPGENGTSLGRLMVTKELEREWNNVMSGCMDPLREFLRNDYKPIKEVKVVKVADDGEKIQIQGSKQAKVLEEEAELDDESVPTVTVAAVNRKRYVRGDLRYGFRWACSIIGIRPRGIFRRL